MSRLRRTTLIVGISLFLWGCGSNSLRTASVLPTTPSLQASRNPAEPSHYRVVYSFKDRVSSARVRPDGAEPVSGLIEDAAGNLYGTTVVGGTGYGTVFKIDPNGNETVLHAFNGKDGSLPFGGLIIDPDGNLYGTTNGGGSAGFGVVFKIDTSGQETTLHNFIQSDGANPLSALTRDLRGNLYGTTYAGGPKNYGLAFKIDRSGVFTVIHNFDGTDGISPHSPLLLVSGRLYGTTFGGGSLGGGVVFTMDLSGNETVLYNFGQRVRASGRFPADALVRDQVGNLYGTTEGGGDRSCRNGCGVVYKLDTNGNETVLHKFIGLDGLSGRGLIKDAGGNLYGTTVAGGRYDLGVLYTLSPTGAFRVRYNFGSTNGALPLSSLVRDSKRNLFGTTSTGGQYGRGVVFEFTP